MSSQLLFLNLKSVIICNNNEFGSVINLDDILEDNSIQGVWDTGQIPLSNNQIDLDGFAPGDYELFFSTEPFSAPCPGNTYSVFITVDDCNCPAFDQSERTFCNLTQSIELDQFNIFGFDGSWNLIDANGNAIQIDILNEVLSFNTILSGSYNLEYTFNDSSYPTVCESNIAFPVFFEEALSSGTALPTINFCQGDVIIVQFEDLIENEDDGGIWLSNNTEVPDELNIAGLDAGIYSFEYFQRAGNICPESSTPFDIEIFDAPSFQFISEDVLCFGTNDGSIELILEGPDEDYICYLNDVAQGENKLFENLAPGDYDIYIQDANGCISDVQTITITQPEPISVSLGNDQLLNFQDPFTIEAIINIIISDIGEITWSDLSGVLNEENLSYSSIANSDNTISVEIEDVNGCVAFDQIEIRVVQQDEDIYIPNIFTPFSQDRNDAFIIQNTDAIDIIKGAYIYDRWGNLVYSQENVVPDDEFEVWNGDYGDTPAIQGVYVYLIELTYDNGRNDVLVGDVTLVR